MKKFILKNFPLKIISFTKRSNEQNNMVSMICNYKQLLSSKVANAFTRRKNGLVTDGRKVGECKHTMDLGVSTYKYSDKMLPLRAWAWTYVQARCCQRRQGRELIRRQAVATAGMGVGVRAGTLLST